MSAQSGSATRRPPTRTVWIMGGLGIAVLMLMLMVGGYFRYRSPELIRQARGDEPATGDRTRNPQDPAEGDFDQDAVAPATSLQNQSSQNASPQKQPSSAPRYRRSPSQGEGK